MDLCHLSLPIEKAEPDLSLSCEGTTATAAGCSSEVLMGYKAKIIHSDSGHPAAVLHKEGCEILTLEVIQNLVRQSFQELDLTLKLSCFE